jgi:hypothetical protein
MATHLLVRPKKERAQLPLKQDRLREHLLEMILLA